MNILDIIAKKRDGNILTKEEIVYFVQEYTKGSITDYQAAALVMAIYIQGMNEQETTDLTMAMAYSGDVLDLSILGNVVDKHSTGGVGDKITLILIPIMAAMGVSVAKMSGRGLGFTGGTIDKLKSIPGYQVDITIPEFIRNVQEIGVSLIGQTLNLAPADKKLYALRDTISCTDSIPLIASSIMSKKIAAGANKIVVDVTCGSGAFLKTRKQATEFASLVQKIGMLAKKETVCVITNMDEPLGRCVGNSLELKEAVKFLRGEMQPDVKEVTLTLGAYMLKLDGKGMNITQNKKAIETCIESGKAYQKFLQLVERQGGDSSFIQNLEKLEQATYIIPVISLKEGYVQKIEAEGVGKLSCFLGAGRIKKEDNIDNAVGIVLQKKVEDFVKKGEILAYVHANDKEKGETVKRKLRQLYQIGEEKKLKFIENPIIIEEIEKPE